MKYNIRRCLEAFGVVLVLLSAEGCCSQGSLDAQNYEVSGLSDLSSEGDIPGGVMLQDFSDHVNRWNH
jgi:hypothetical protein